MLTPTRISDLLAAAGLAELATVQGNPDALVLGISGHAQKTRRGELFVAIRGTSHDSHTLLSDAVEAGARVLLVEREAGPFPGVTVVRVPSTRAALGPLALAFYGNPLASMRVVGVTGTNGKTSVCHILASILTQAGMKPGIVGTVGAKFAGQTVPLGTTTPGPLELAEIFAAMKISGVDSVVMECSSHAIEQHRIGGIPFSVNALTNITQDHLDYHRTMDAYVEAKYALFSEHTAKHPGAVACFNLDDPFGEAFEERYGSAGRQVNYTRTPGRTALVRAEDIHLTPKATQFTLTVDGQKGSVYTALAGDFNVSNMLTATSCAHALGVDFRAIVRGLEKAAGVAGRFEFVEEGQPFSVIVDYAHTPDALQRLLRSARRLCQGRLIVAFGCGGDRDRTKRPIMGRIASEGADFVIVTSDNPRSEDPAAIAADILQGVGQGRLGRHRVARVLDRRSAIEQAISLAATGDVVVIAGKGHEDYQDIGSTRLQFDDRQVAREVLRAQMPTFAHRVSEIDSNTETLA